MQTTAIQPATNHTKSATAEKSSLNHIHAWLSTNTKPHQAAAAAIHKLKNRFLNASIEQQLLSEWILLLKSQELENLYITSLKTSAINQMQHLSRRSSLHTSYYLPSPQQRPLYNNKNNNTAKFTSTVVDDDDDDARRCCRRRQKRCTDAADDLVPPIAATTLDHQLTDSAADSPACNCIMIEHTHTQKKSNPKENSVAISAHAWSYGLHTYINSSSPAWPMMITSSADHSDHGRL